jgi:hypothetical protein
VRGITVVLLVWLLLIGGTTPLVASQETLARRPDDVGGPDGYVLSAPYEDVRLKTK